MALNKINDMTEGSILKKMLLFAVPLFIGDLFELLYSFTDTVISSHFIGTNALAAIGVTTSNSYVLFRYGKRSLYFSFKIFWLKR